MYTEKIADLAFALQKIAAPAHNGDPLSQEARANALLGLRQLNEVARVIGEATHKIEQVRESITTQPDRMAMFAGLDTLERYKGRPSYDEEMLAEDIERIGKLFDAYDNFRRAEADAWRKALR